MLSRVATSHTTRPKEFKEESLENRSPPSVEKIMQFLKHRGDLSQLEIIADKIECIIRADISPLEEKQSLQASYLFFRSKL